MFILWLDDDTCENFKNSAINPACKDSIQPPTHMFRKPNFHIYNSNSGEAGAGGLLV
jgi:hypothetical protein